jgi:hypothetical protein
MKRSDSPTTSPDLHPSYRPPLRLACALLVLAVLAGAGAGWAGNPVPIGQGVSVRFSQLNYLSDSPGGPPTNYSSVGEADFSFDSTATELLSGVYLNVYTSTDGVNYQWEVQDLYLQVASSDELLTEAPGVHFDLGVADGTPLSSISFQVSLTSAPVGGSPPPPPPPPPPPHQGTALSAPVTAAGTATAKLPLAGQPVYNANVTTQDYHVGGFNGGGSGARPAVGAWGGGGALAARPVAWAGAAYNQIPAINEDLMGCAPGGIARSIRYMLNLRRRGGPNAQTIYQGLYNAMGTGANGTTGANMVNGKANWAAANGLNINTGFVNVGQAMNILAGGGDVEINIAWNGGGHVAMIVQIVAYSNGTYQITYVDDPNQGNGAAENGLHTILVAANGQILGTNAWVAGLLGETMQ